MAKSGSLIKTVIVSAAAGLAAHAAQKTFIKKTKETAPRMPRDLSDQERWMPLSPISKLLWFTHPQKALQFFLLQHALAFAWKMAKKFFRE